MKKTNISSLKRDLSRHLDYVRKGGTVRIFDRDTPIAEIVPLTGREAAADALEATLDRLEKQGSIIRGKGIITDELLNEPLPKAKASVVEALLEERREGR